MIGKRFKTIKFFLLLATCTRILFHNFLSSKYYLFIMTSIISKSKARLLITDYFDTLINLFDLEFIREKKEYKLSSIVSSHTYGIEYSTNDIEIINTLQSKIIYYCNKITEDFNGTELELLIHVINPLYIIINESDKYELIELSKDVIYTRIINNKLFLCRYLVPSNVETHVSNLLTNYENESILNIYEYFISTDSSLIKEPNKFIKSCNKRNENICTLYQRIENKELIDVNKMIDKSNEYYVFELYKLIKNKHDVDIINLFRNCHANDICKLYRLLLDTQPDIITNLNINEIINYCNCFELAILYEMIPNKQDVKVNRLINLAYSGIIPKLFKLILNKRDVDFNKMFRKSNSHNILELYQLMLADESMKDILIDVKEVDIDYIIRKCDGYALEYLYSIIPNKSDVDVNSFMRMITNNYEQMGNILELYSSIENRENLNTDELFNLFNSCNPSDYIDLYKLTPNKKDVDINYIIHYSYVSDLIELYKLIPNKKDVDINKLIAKFDPGHDVLSLYKLIPNKQDVNNDLLIEVCHKDRLLELHKLIKIYTTRIL